MTEKPSKEPFHLDLKPSNIIADEKDFGAISLAALEMEQAALDVRKAYFEAMSEASKDASVAAFKALFRMNVKVVRRRGSASRITAPPAHRTTELLRFVFPKKSFDLVFSQIILDMREEYFEALAEGARWRARWRHVQLWWSLGMATLLWAGTSSARKAYDLWRAFSS